MSAIDVVLIKPDARSAAPTLEAFGSALAPEAAKHRALRKLHELLTGLAPQAPLAERAVALERLAEWLRNTGRIPIASEPGEPPQIARLSLLVRALQTFPSCRRALAELVRNTLQESSAIYFLARLGLPSDRGFLGETIDRLSRSFLPEPEDDRDFAQLVARIFPKERDLEWLERVPKPLFTTAAELLRDPNQLGLSAWLPLERAAADSLSLLATRISALGLSESLRARSRPTSVRSSPFYRLSHATEALLASLHDEHGDDLSHSAKVCRELVAECQAMSGDVVANLEERGVSVDVVYRLESLALGLERYLQLLELLTCNDPSLAYAGAHDELVRLLRARHRDRDIVEIARNNLHLLARKIIERAGHTGEHYITSTRGEYVKMLLSAGGGGFLTAGTTALKFMVGWGHFAPFVDGALASINYAVSFILMQLLGFTLATKQPSMTAAALAGTLRDSAGQQELAPLVRTIARITRSQLAAAIGNIGVVIPAAIALDFACRTRTGHGFLDEETAHYALHSLDPLHTGTAFYAALTGVLLWMGSVSAGWIENWAIYRRLPEAIAGHRIGRFVGRGVTGWASRAFTRNISGFGGNATLGLLLGMTPSLGKFFGLPLEIRHVTLSTGALTLATCSLGEQALESGELPRAALGIATIAAFNFSVSFWLALAVALRARGADRSDRSRLLRSVLATFFRSPLQFLVPPRDDERAPVHGPVSMRPGPH